MIPLLFFPSASFVTPSPSPFVPSTPSVPSTSEPPQTIVQCLRRLGSMPGCKNVLKKLDYDKFKIQEVNHLPPRFDGTQLFVLPAAEVSSSQSRAKSLDGMDKQYDGHVWTKTQTTNITNDVGPAFRSSPCVGHLQCQNPSCDYLQRAHRTSKVNDTEFEGFTKDPFPLSGVVPSRSTLVCRICKNPPNALLCAMPKCFTSMGRSLLKEPAFISVLINTQSRLETAETIGSASIHLSRSILSVRLKPLTARSSLKPARTLLVSSSFLAIMSHNVSSP
jgi:hypothetical protein